MEMIIQEMTQNLDLHLSAYDEKDFLKQLALCKKLVLDTIREISNLVNKHEFYTFDEDTQIRYNKEWLPPLYAKFLYFDKWYQLECNRFFSPRAEVQSFIEEELKSIRYFFDAHSSFCQYCDTGNIDKDWYLFTVHNSHPSPVDNKKLGLTPHINPGCLLAACYLANKEYGALLQKELKNEEMALRVNKDEPLAIFRGTDTDLIEEAYAKHASGLYFVNGEPATVEYFIDCARKQFGRELKNHPVLANKVRNRKPGAKTFLKRLDDGFIAHSKKVNEGMRPHKDLRKPKI